MRSLILILLISLSCKMQPWQCEELCGARLVESLSYDSNGNGICVCKKRCE